MENNYARDFFEAMHKHVEAMAAHIYGEDEIDFVALTLRPDGAFNITVYGKDDKDGKYTADEVISYGLFDGIKVKEREIYERSVKDI